MSMDTYIGIDISQSHLDMALHPSGRAERFANGPAGIAALVRLARELQPVVVVLEATGGLESPLAAAMGTAGLPVAVVNPRQVRDFAKA